MSLARGSFVQVTCGEQTVKAMVLLASSNGKSLMLGFDGAFWVEGGAFMGSMPVLMDDAGVYRDLIHGQVVRIEPGQA